MLRGADSIRYARGIRANGCIVDYEKAPPKRGFPNRVNAADQSPSVSSEALPPAAVVLTVIVFSVVKRGR